MMVLHVEVGLVLLVGFGSNGDTSEKYTVFLPFISPNPLGTGSPDLIECSVLRIQYDTAMVRIFSQYVCEKKSIYPNGR